MMNVMTTRNKLQYPGVGWDRRQRAYAARLEVDGEERLLGYFTNENDAYIARTKARRALRIGEVIPNRGRRIGTRDRRKNAR